jgi:general secretion pathway protein G
MTQPRGRSVFVLGVLGILAACLVLNVVRKLGSNPEQARFTAARFQIGRFGTALGTFEADNGFYPKGADGLSALVHAPRGAQHWHGPYLQGGIPLDPWGHAYVYECPGKHKPAAYDLLSMGPDGHVGGADDVTNWQQPNQK